MTLDGADTPFPYRTRTGLLRTPALTSPVSLHSEMSNPGTHSMTSEGSGGSDGEGCAFAVSERCMLRFLREIGAVRNVVDWSTQTIAEVNRMFGLTDLSAAPEHLSAAGDKLCEVTERLSAMRLRLLRMAGENKDLRGKPGSSTAMLRTRAFQLRQTCAGFEEAIRDLRYARRKQRGALARSMHRDIVCAKRGVSADDAGEIMASGDGDAELEAVMSRDGAASVEIQLKVQNVKERSAEMGKLAEILTELNIMLDDMAILADSQLMLLDDVESREDEVVPDTRSRPAARAAPELLSRECDKKRRRILK